MAWEFELVAGPYGGPTDGAVWDGKALLFSVYPEGLILRFHPENGEVTEFRRYMLRVRGLAFDPKGTLYGAQAGVRRIVRFNADGSTSRMESLIDGRPHNQPDDLVVDRQGRIWFSDPHDPEAREGGPDPFGPLEHTSVLRLEPSTGGSWKIRRMTYDTRSPRGVLVSPDERTLYVAESNEKPDGIREIRAYPILEDGVLGSYRVLHAFGEDHRGADGMCLDRDGNIVACAGSNKVGPGPMIYVFSPEGRILETHPVPGDCPTNCGFGDTDRTSLYVTTAEGQLFRARNTGHTGWALYPPAK